MSMLVCPPGAPVCLLRDAQMRVRQEPLPKKRDPLSPSCKGMRSSLPLDGEELRVGDARHSPQSSCSPAPSSDPQPAQSQSSPPECPARCAERSWEVSANECPEGWHGSEQGLSGGWEEGLGTEPGRGQADSLGQPPVRKAGLRTQETPSPCLNAVVAFRKYSFLNRGPTFSFCSESSKLHSQF